MSEGLFRGIELVPRVDEIPAALCKLTRGKQVFTVIDSYVARLYPEILPTENVYVLEAGEQSKTLESVEKICLSMLETDMRRGVTVVAIGGGVTGDIAGFVSSVYMRGADFVNVPTTLLGQVDGAIGGKTGVNLEGYKNIIGSFKMPQAVLICPEMLATLSEREWRCGMGELVKTALLDDELYGYMKINAEKIVGRSCAETRAAVEKAVFFKKHITDSDPEEKGRRIILNLGHTVGHALEKCDNHRLSHGEYVLLGLKTELKMNACPFEKEAGELIAKVGLPRLPRISAAEITQAAYRDKKNNADKITVLGVNSPGDVYVCEYSSADFEEKYSSSVEQLIRSGEAEFE